VCIYSSIVTTEEVSDSNHYWKPSAWWIARR